MSGDYTAFLAQRAQLDADSGFAPLWMPDFLFDFQASLTEWSIRKGRAAILADCGLGKGPMQYVWGENVVRKTNRPVLALTPLGVSAAAVREAEKFGIAARRSTDGKPFHGITVTNYERLHLFNPDDFAGVICDESGILKNFEGVRKAQITEFMRTRPYRLTCSATPAPNDYIELGTTSEALGQLGYMDMLSRFFKNDQNSNHPNRLWAGSAKWRFRGHAERDFWRWVCSWARAIRKPSDLGFDDGRFVLPPLTTREHVVKTSARREGMLFATPAMNLHEQREERRQTIRERCEMAASLAADARGSSVSWCHLNAEGDLLTRLIPGAVQVSGDDSDDEKEEKFLAFESGQISRLVTKDSIAGWGLNWQHCAFTTLFPSHSAERWYQSLRRLWRFGQEQEVFAHMVTSEGEVGVMANLLRKAAQMDIMFSRLVATMNDELHIKRASPYVLAQENPTWL